MSHDVTKHDQVLIEYAKELAVLNEARLAVASQHGLTVDRVRVITDAIERRRASIKTGIRYFTDDVLRMESANEELS